MGASPRLVEHHGAARIPLHLVVIVLTGLLLAATRSAIESEGTGTVCLPWAGGCLVLVGPMGLLLRNAWMITWSLLAVVSLGLLGGSGLLVVEAWKAGEWQMAALGIIATAAGAGSWAAARQVHSKVFAPAS